MNFNIYNLFEENESRGSTEGLFRIANDPTEASATKIAEGQHVVVEPAI